MSRWGDAGVWAGDGLRRESFFFDCDGVALYGSLYAAQSRPLSVGLVACNSWGFEGDEGDKLVHGMAIDAARAGGVGMTFHYPGVGDSGGELDEATMDALVASARAALSEAARREPGCDWTLAGFRFGAAVACLAAAPAAERLLLVQPSLDPRAYLERVARSARRVAARTGVGTGLSVGGDFAYGYPLPRALLAHDGDDAAAALAAFGQPGAVVRHEEPPLSDPLPSHFDEIVVSGAWKFAARNTTALRHAATRWSTG